MPSVLLQFFQFFFQFFTFPFIFYLKKFLLFIIADVEYIDYRIYIFWVIIFSVKAFSPEAAVEVAERAIKAADDLLKGMNATAWRDATERAEAVLELATERLIAAQSRMTLLRDETGSVDVETEAGVRNCSDSDNDAALLRTTQRCTI